MSCEAPSLALASSASSPCSAASPALPRPCLLTTIVTLASGVALNHASPQSAMEVSPKTDEGNKGEDGWSIDEDYKQGDIQNVGQLGTRGHERCYATDRGNCKPEEASWPCAVTIYRYEEIRTHHHEHGRKCALAWGMRWRQHKGVPRHDRDGDP